ncbi:MAG: MlaD family protein [candidate division Zixibacteria bacterium]|nr:MlaD family protein [candidate division Zixibacteria bacterium]
MKRSINIGWGQLRVGLLIMFAIAALMWASLGGGGTSIFDKKQHFVAYFRNVNGLLNGSPVWMSGVEVGNVKKVEFVNLDSLRQVKVIARVKEDLWPMLTPGTEVQIGTIGFLGDKYVEIIPGPVGKGSVAEGATLPTRDVGDASSMLKAGEKALLSAGAVVNNLDTLLSNINNGEGTLGKLATDSSLHIEMVQLIRNLTKLTSSLQITQDKLSTSIGSMSSSVASLSNQIQNKSGTLGQLLNDPKLYDNLNSTTARLNSVVARIHASEGTLGLLVSDTGMYKEVVNLVVRINNLVADIEQNPRKYFKVSVF